MLGGLGVSYPMDKSQRVRRLAIFLAASLLTGAPAAAACMGVNSKTKQRQSVHQIYRTSVSHPRRYFAETTHAASGRPVIIYYRRYAQAPAYFKSFVRAHECCHHLGNRNEIAANCCALKRLRLSRGSTAVLRNYIISRDVNSETKSDHKGQGSKFWSKTERSCPTAASR
jgi:hypothetical protein